jgi:hypothetical protein
MADRPLSDAELAEIDRRRVAFDADGECMRANPDGSMTFYGAALEYAQALAACCPRLLADLAEARRERDEAIQYRTGHLPACGGRDELARQCECGYLQGEAYRELYASLAARTAELEVAKRLFLRVQDEVSISSSLEDEIRAWLKERP